MSACGAQLGPTASLYASDNVAADIEAVRAALGYELLDFYDGSNAALDIQAYAARFPGRLRSAVLDSPATTLGFAGFDPLTLDQWLKAAPRARERGLRRPQALFSPDGLQILFMCENQGTLNRPPPDYADGSNIVKVIDTPDRFENWPSWGPAG